MARKFSFSSEGNVAENPLEVKTGKFSAPEHVQAETTPGDHRCAGFQSRALQLRAAPGLFEGVPRRFMLQRPTGIRL
jgi:hypothetical protein